MKLPVDVGVLIPAAGRGVRAGGSEPKQFRSIAGVPMLLRAIRPFRSHPRVCQIVVALPQESCKEPPQWLEAENAELLRIVSGGATRADSVEAALDALDPRCRIVLVHDAARPFVSLTTIDAVIAVAAEHGALAAVPVSDTVKRVDETTRLVTETLDRRGLWRAQTPQGCPREMLQNAYSIAGPTGVAQYTDESALLEAAGYQVELVPDSPENIKVTTESDFSTAEVLVSL